MTGIIGDDEAEIEAEIQRELDEISEENLEIEDLENEDLISPYSNEKDADILPDSLQQYLRAVQSRTEGVEQDVRDCDNVLNKLPIGSSNDDEQILAQKIKEALGDGCHDNPLDIRNKVLSEIEELEQNEEKEKIRRESNADNMAIDIIRTDISDQIRILEEAAEKQLLELEEKQANKNQKRIEWYEDMKREESKRMEKEQEMRRQRQQELEVAQKRLNENQQVVKEKMEKEAKQEKKKIDLLQQQFQVEIKEIEEESKKEKAALEEMKNQEAEYQRNKQNDAAMKIQKTYRGHRVYLQHKEILQQKRTERIKKYEEKLEQQEQEEKKKTEEIEKRKQELQEKKRIEEERKGKEERWKKEREEEKRREAEKTKMEQLRKQEEEKKKKEAKEKEEQKRREELRKEEEKKREEAKKRELELIETQKKEEEERRKAEEKRREEELRREIERKENEEKRIEEERKAAARRKELEEIERQKKKEEEDKREEEKRKSEKEKLDKETGNPDINQNSTKPGKSEEIQNSLALDHLEERRRQWVKDHTPWSSTTSEDRIQPVAKMKSRQRPRRPFSASRNLPSLTEEQLLQASPPRTTLNKVVRVFVRSLPACNMHGVKRCPDLQSLTIHDCGLMAVEGLEECTSIKELRVQDNCIEYVSCRVLHNLEEIQLSNNSLTSLQGFDGCRGLRCLDLTNNKVTRLGDLSSCCKLQTLCIDNNQLIMTKGLSSLPNLQSLSCANNHLPNVKEIDSCQLLQSLNLQGNNLQQPPLLSNHVLLRELRLDDNSISTLEPLSQVWLPSLRLLSASQNSISKLESLEGLFMLETLDVSHNLISDLDSLTPGLSHCRELKVLRITGNPVNEDPDCRKAIVESLSFLTKLDDETLQPKQSSSEGPSSPFTIMCHNHLTEYTNMMARHATEMSTYDENTVDPRKVHERLNIKSKQYEERYQLAVTHLQQHEQYGTGDQEYLKLSHDASRPNEKQLNECKIKKTILRNETCEQAGSSQSHGASATVNKPKANDANSFEGVETGRGDKQQRKLADDPSTRTTAAVKIQSVWRGWHVRHLIDVHMKKWLAAVTIQATWRGYQVRSRMRKSLVSRARRALWEARHHAAATTIQACYRGYRVRQRIASALRAVNYYNDDDDDDDFNYDEEVDLSAFDYDSGLLDEGWTPTDTPQLPSRGPILPGPGHSSFQNRSKQSDAYMPRQAWRSADSPMEQGLLTNQRGAPRVHSKQQSPEQDLMSVTSGTQSHLTHRAEEMSNEWGLRDPSTAELMWKRANRMKYNPARKRKLLDPNKRLALFKKLDEANKLREVKPPPKRQPQRVDYFTARDASMLPSGSSTPTLERETKAQMTYSWVYNQGVIHVDQDEPGLGSTEPTKNKKSPAKRNASKSRSPISLPHMDPVSLTGRNVPLVSSPALMQDQMSKDSTPTARRYSSASEPRSVVSEASSLNPEKSNSAGARMTKERKRR